MKVGFKFEVGDMVNLHWDNTSFGSLMRVLERGFTENQAGSIVRYYCRSVTTQTPELTPKC